MIFRNLDNNDDWTFGKGKQNYAQDDNAIATNLKTRLKSFLNDCFFDMEAGLDWFNLLGKDFEKLVSDVKKCIITSEGIYRLNDFDVYFDREKREITITYNVDTINSPNLNGIIGVQDV
jgi:hypothetical protein